MNEITNNKNKCARALEYLKEVIDPEIGLNVVDLGLIYQVDFEEDSKAVFCTMTLTTQFCPMGASIQAGVTNALEEAFPDYIPDVEIIFNPPWNADKISPEGRYFLNG